MALSLRALLRSWRPISRAVPSSRWQAWWVRQAASRLHHAMTVSTYLSFCCLRKPRRLSAAVLALEEDRSECTGVDRWSSCDKVDPLLSCEPLCLRSGVAADEARGTASHLSMNMSAFSTKQSSHSLQGRRCCSCDSDSDSDRCDSVNHTHMNATTINNNLILQEVAAELVQISHMTAW